MLDVIYGIGINEYCEKHGITIYDLIKRCETDIQLIFTNYLKYAQKEKFSEQDYIDIEIIKKALDKKRKHLIRLNKWKNINN